ncbi:DUF1080 domain-containing protein [Cohnella nanjingensis]|uniref:DUF1080 domain-containing protein n=1 Tax=Cohnella nanjingensis TaxID=1387779 RepID=A0A7X0RSU3_9BACL|nr:DUF1080 domain-containing protein [Cohnella nanjingensis]
MNWDMDAKAATYKVERKMNSGDAYTTIASSLTGSSYRDTTALNGTSYIYRVASVDSLGSVVNTSNEATAANYAYRDFFTNGSSNWTANAGTWSASTGVYNQTSKTNNPPMSTLNGLTYGNFQAQAVVKINGSSNPDNWAGIVFRKTNAADSPWTSGYLFVIQANGTVGFSRQGTAVGPAASTGLDPTAQYVTLKVVANGSTLRGYVNGSLVITTTDTTWSSGYFGLVTFNNSASFQNVLITNSIPATPTSLSGSSATGSQVVNLTWTASNANSYVVMRATSASGPFTMIGTANGTSFTDNYALINHAYYYLVTGVNYAGAESNDSNIAGPIAASY